MAYSHAVEIFASLGLRNCNYKSYDLYTVSKGKEVIHPLLPERVPCYDLAPIAGFNLSRLNRDSDTPDFVGLTGSVCKRQERIHRGIADPRLLLIPRS